MLFSLEVFGESDAHEIILLSKLWDLHDPKAKPNMTQEWIFQYLFLFAAGAPVWTEAVAWRGANYFLSLLQCKPHSSAEAAISHRWENKINFYIFSLPWPIAALKADLH